MLSFFASGKLLTCCSADHSSLTFVLYDIFYNLIHIYSPGSTLVRNWLIFSQVPLILPMASCSPSFLLKVLTFPLYFTTSFVTWSIILTWFNTKIWAISQTGHYSPPMYHTLFYSATIDVGIQQAVFTGGTKIVSCK